MVRNQMLLWKIFEMKKKLFVTDFDGTLLKDDKTISQKDIQTLRTLGQKKIVTAVATGRSLYSFEKTLMSLGMTSSSSPLPVDYVIFSTGAGIIEYPGGKLIYEKAVSPHDIKKITAYFNQRKFDYMVHKAIPDTHWFQYKSHTAYNPDFQERISLYNEYAGPLADDHYYFEPATEVLAILQGGADRDAIQQIRMDLSGFSVIHATSPLDHQSAWIEVFHKEVSKAKTVSRLALELGISQQNVISVGNDYNDQDLLAGSGKGYVVENAPHSLKKVFQVVSSNNHCGVSQAAEEAGALT